MRKLALVLCVLVMLTAATATASTARPEPQTFTIAGYTTLFEELEPLPNGHLRYHILAQGGGEDLCVVDTGTVCGVSGDLNGRFTFEEWIDVNPANGKAMNEGIVTIISAAPGGSAVVKFKGEIDQTTLTVSGKFGIEKKQGAGAYDDLKGHGDYAGGATFVFAVTFTGKLKD